MQNIKTSNLNYIDFVFLHIEVMTDLYNLVDEKSGIRSPMISAKYWKIIKDNAAQLDSTIVYDRDFNYNYFGFKVINTK